LQEEHISVQGRNASASLNAKRAAEKERIERETKAAEAKSDSMDKEATETKKREETSGGGLSGGGRGGAAGAGGGGSGPPIGDAASRKELQVNPKP
jgi:hypothetical protein